MTAQAQLKSTVKSAVKHIAPGSWRRHPGVRTGEQLTRGERAADKMRNSMGSWMFVFVALAFLAVWMILNVLLDKSTGHTFDAYPFILLNLVLSCVAALQGAILLIAAKRWTRWPANSRSTTTKLTANPARCSKSSPGSSQPCAPSTPSRASSWPS